MALRCDSKVFKRYISVEDPQEEIVNELVISNSYIVISSVSGNKEFLDISVCFYDEKKEKLLRKSTYRFTPSVADGSENFIRQGYQHLKTLKEFAGAADC